MVGDAFGEAHEIVVVVAEGRGPGQHADIRHGSQPGGRCLCPVIAILAVDGGAGVEMESAAHFGLLVAEDHLGTGLGRSKRRREAGDTAADDEDVAMGVAAGIVIRILLLRRNAKTGGAADEGLVDRMPEGLRPHEGLVVEAGGEEGREEVVDLADVEGQRRPTVLRFDLHAVEHFLHRGADVRLAAGGIARHVEQRVRLFRAGGQDAARTVILERPAGEM